MNHQMATTGLADQVNPEAFSGQYSAESGRYPVNLEIRVRKSALPDLNGGKSIYSRLLYQSELRADALVCRLWPKFKGCHSRWVDAAPMPKAYPGTVQ